MVLQGTEQVAACAFLPRNASWHHLTLEISSDPLSATANALVEKQGGKVQNPLNSGRPVTRTSIETNNTSHDLPAA